MAKSSAKEMLVEPLLPTTHHLLVLLVLLVVVAPHYRRLPWPSLANSLRVRTLHTAEDLGLHLVLDFTLVPDSPLAVEDGSPNDGLLSL